MRQIKTLDGSFTLYNEQYKESYHSVSGAMEEAFKKYVVPCEIKNFKQINILDICFGLGYNSAAAIHTGLLNNVKINITGLEKDDLSLDINELDIPGNMKGAFSIIQEVYKNGEYDRNAVSLKLILGDARKTIQKIKDTFDVVFLDPFSTMKNPELWSVEFFKQIRKRMKPNGILATYSSSAIVRGGLLEAGFNIGNGPMVGRARPSTLAVIKRKLPELSEEDKKHIRAFGKPFRDPRLNWDKDQIIQNRSLFKLF